jgi:uncharacterized membrane protein YgaE (UPF0421/DUF939 family)
MPAEKAARAYLTVLEHSARTAVSAMASLVIAQLFRLPEPYWAPITTLVVITQFSLGAALSISWKRFIGTALGALLAGFVASHFRPNLWLFGGAVFLLGLFFALLRLDRAAYRFGAIAIAIVLLIPRAERAWQVAFHRFVEVSIGIGVALLFETVWPERNDPVQGI